MVRRLLERQGSHDDLECATDHAPNKGAVRQDLGRRVNKFKEETRYYTKLAYRGYSVPIEDEYITKLRSIRHSGEISGFMFLEETIYSGVPSFCVQMDKLAELQDKVLSEIEKLLEHQPSAYPLDDETVKPLIDKLDDMAQGISSFKTRLSGLIDAASMCSRSAKKRISKNAKS